jgi:nucleotide-binding universal stress UspA family protein
VVRYRLPDLRVPDSGLRAPSKPVLLATFDVPFDPEAAVVAVDAAVEAGRELIVVNVVELLPLPLSVVMGYDQLDYTPEMEESLRAPAQLAASLGVRVDRIRVRTLHPVEALMELVREREPGLLVFGPDRGAMAGRRYRKAARAIRDASTCLVWLPGD